MCIRDRHYAKPNPEYFGMAKGRNVIYIHLESFQQFLIDYKLKAVSYTHLDVYKRQGLPYPSSHRPPEVQITDTFLRFVG